MGHVGSADRHLIRDTRPVRVVLLDLDDTLIPDVAAAREAIKETLRALDGPSDQNAVDIVLRSARTTWRSNPYRSHPELAQVSSWEALWVDARALDLPTQASQWLAGFDRQVWRSALDALTGDDGGAREAAALYRTHRRAAVRPFPSVPTLLDSLRERHVLWLATNGCRHLQRTKLEEPGLVEQFAKVFVSAEVGCAKDHSAFARAVRDQLAAEGREICLVVGDGVTVILGSHRLASGQPSTYAEVMAAQRRSGHLGTARQSSVSRPIAGV